jgi:hypothetical protein
MGEGAASFFRLLSAGPPRVWGHQARCILLLRARFETADINAALAHAARFGAFEYAAVERIVEARAAPRTLDEYVAEETARRLEKTLGGSRTAPRDLTEYDRLPVVGAPILPAQPSHETSCPSAPPSETTLPAGDDLVLERLRRHLQFLGLTHTRAALDEHLAWATRERPGATALFEHVLAAEVGAKLEQRINYRVLSSGLKERKTLEAFDFDFQPKLDRATVVELARLDFVRRRDDVVITGKAGTGKSHILKAFALRACEQGIRLRYARCVDLLDELHAAIADGSYPAAPQAMGERGAPDHRRRRPRSDQKA